MATPKEWRLWRARLRRERPLLWFVWKRLWDRGLALFWTVWIRRPLVDAWWAAKYRLLPRYRYHVVRTGLSPGYHDADMRMLHACFALLVECVERRPATIDFGADERRRMAWQEIEALYRWWREERPARTLPARAALPEDMAYPGALFDEDNRDRPETVRWQEESRRENALAYRWAAEDQAMLARLVAVRPYLWV